MSICDRLRTESMRAAVTASPKTGASDDTYRSPYDSADARRMNDALEELRGYCRTEDALRSFEAFEARLRKNTNIPARLFRTGTSDAGSDFSDDDAGCILRARLKTERALHSADTPVPSKGISRIPTPIKVEPRLPSIFGRLALTKSKTTGNLATLSNFSSPKLSQSSTSHGAEPPSSGQEGHFRRASGARVMSKAQKAEAKEPITSTNTSRSKIESNTSKPLKRQHLRQSSTTASLPHLYRDMSFTKVDRDSQIGEGASFGAIESGHSLPPANSRPSRNVDIQMAGTEMVIGSKSKRKPDRQSSGLSQVKKMGRRVGGSMSWAGSAEDLNAAVSGDGNDGGAAR
jgi:hypothetical protein